MKGLTEIQVEEVAGLLKKLGQDCVVVTIRGPGARCGSISVDSSHISRNISTVTMCAGFDAAKRHSARVSLFCMSHLIANRAGLRCSPRRKSTETSIQNSSQHRYEFHKNARRPAGGME